MSRDLWKLPVTELGALMARKALSPVELLAMYLERCDRLNGALNAIVTFDRDGALEQARQSEQRMQAGARRGLLDGIPVTVKDNLFVKGLRATWGSRLFESFTAPEDDLVVKNLRAAGLLIVGKTNTPELALASHTDNLIFGKTRNPWNLALTPGGSSGGAVAAVAAGLVPLAVGTDAGGSIRRPAGYTGIVGLRPTTGRIPRRFGFPALANDFQAVSPAARTVEELHALFHVLAQPDPFDRASLAFGDSPLPERLDAAGLPRLRIRYAPGTANDPIDAPVRASLARAAKQLEALGHEVMEGAAPFDSDQVDQIRAVLSGAAVARVVTANEHWRDLVGSAIEGWADAGLKLSAADYVRALDALQELRVRATADWQSFDILLTATSTAMPWPVESPWPKQIEGRDVGARASGQFAGFVNAAGLPAISVPIEPSAASVAAPGVPGVPIGMQLVGGFGRDLQVLQLAQQFERAHPWADRWPQYAG